MIALRQPRIPSDQTIFWAILLSIVLHILIAYVIPAINVEDIKQQMAMTVELATPPTAKPDPVVTPQPQPEIPLELPPPPQIKRPEPVIKQEIRPVLPPVPSPITEPSATPAPESEAKPQPPSVTTSESKDDSRPVTTPTEPSKPVGPATPDVSDDRNQYGDMLTRHIGKYKQYPRIAQMRNWEGDVVLELQLDANGNLTSSRIYKASGKESLDNQALEMVKKASPFPGAPASLRGRSFSIMVPVSFRLDN